MRFKLEVFLLVTSIILFTVSVFLYAYAQEPSSWLAAALELHPYRGYAVSFVGFGSVLMTVASFSYVKRSKNYV